MKLCIFTILLWMKATLYSDAINEKVLICGVAKNCESGFENLYFNILNFSKLFRDYRVIIYENNSLDQTKLLFRSMANCNSRVTFIEEDLSDLTLKQLCPKQGNYRTEYIARARNIVLNYALHSQFDDYKYLIMLDLDGFSLINPNEIKDSIDNAQQDWDAIFANGSYDIYAFRSNECRFGPELLGRDNWMDIHPQYGRYLAKKLQDGNWLKVNSAFGGLAIYKRESVKGSYYAGHLSSEMLKTLLNSDFSTDLFCRSFSRKVQSEINRNILRLKTWIRDGCSLKSTCLYPIGSYDFYICEHVFFHNLMIKNGHDKLYINPNLVIKSKEHKNY